MRKFIAIYLIIAVPFWMVAPLSTLAADSGTTTEEIDLGAVALNAAASTTEQFYGIATSTSSSVLVAAGTSTIALGSGEAVGEGATTSEESFGLGKTAISSEEIATTTKAVATTTEDVASAVAAIEDANKIVESAATETATTTDGVATSTAEMATSTIEVATSTEGIDASSTVMVAAVPRSSVLGVWQMAADGADDNPIEFAQFEPSGEYQVSKKIKICGVVKGNAAQLEGVYGQMFYPKDAAFGSNNANGRKGCGQVTGSACKMEKLDVASGFDLLCEKIQKNNTALPLFMSGLSYIDFCTPDGDLLSQAASVYCCDQELAYDDVAGNYDGAVMAKGIDGEFSNMLSSKFTYLPLTKMSVDFNNVYYGAVKQGVETLAAGIGSPELSAKAATVTNATVRNVGNTPARVSLWQDDMGLGKTDGADNIRYGARLSGIDASWTNYAPFETIVMPDALDLGEAVDMDFSVKVLNFPKGSGTSKIDYRGTMKIDAVVATFANQCQSKNFAGTNDAPQTDKPTIKPEVESNDVATSTPPI